ncbi:MAG: DUF3617 domain-containing protein, partial [Pseudobdellovibrionaceae bacterium]
MFLRAELEAWTYFEDICKLYVNQEQRRCKKAGFKDAMILIYAYDYWMKRNIWILLWLLLCTLTLKAQSLKPGVWKAKSSFQLNGIQLPSSEDEECVTATEAKDAKSTIAKELKKNGCELTKWMVKGKKIEASLVCKNNEMDAKGNLHGQFS